MSEGTDSNRPHTNMDHWIQHHVLAEASRRCLKQMVSGNMRHLQESDRPDLTNCLKKVILSAGFGMQLMKNDEE